MTERRGTGQEALWPGGANEGRQDTGSSSKTVKWPIGPYVVTIVLDEGYRFVGITEVALSTDFLSHKQRTATTGVFDVEEYYTDEPQG